MRRETAYKLAGRNHHHAQPGSANVLKVREIRFAHLPPNQLPQALAALSQLKGLSVELGSRDCALLVHYSLADYTLEALEAGLRNAGFHLDESLYVRLLRAVVYFCEETQLHNLHSPERLLKKSNELYIKVYDHHLHGDHDDTPPELREFR